MCRDRKDLVGKKLASAIGSVESVETLGFSWWPALHVYYMDTFLHGMIDFLNCLPENVYVKAVFGPITHMLTNQTKYILRKVNDTNKTNTR